MKRKIISILLVASMVASLGLTGCGNSSSTKTSDTTQSTDKTDTTKDTTAATDGDKVTINWAIWDKDSSTYWTKLKEGFEEENPNITVELTDLGATDYNTVLATQLSGSGSTFDVVSIKDTACYSTLIEKNALEPLNDYITTEGIDLSQYNGITDQIKANDVLYELPFRNDTWVVYYNKDLFDAAGIDYPTNDMTFAEYDKLARSLSSNEFGKQVYGAHYHTWRSTIQLFGALDGTDILGGNYDFLKPYYETVLSEQADGVCQDYATLSTASLHYSNAFSQGNVAMLNIGSWFISTLITKLNAGEYDSSLCGNWGIVQYPHPEGVEAGTTIGTVTGIAVTSASEKKDAAWKFVQFASSEEGAKIVAETGSMPAIVTSEISAILASVPGFPLDQNSKEALTPTKVYMDIPYSKHSAEIDAVLSTYHKDIMNGDISVDDGIAKMNEDVQKVLAQ